MEIRIPARADALVASEAPARKSKFRFVSGTFALLGMVAAGWVAGFKAQNSGHLAEASAWFRHTAVAAVSSLVTWRNWVVAPAESHASPSASGQPVGQESQSDHVVVVERIADGLGTRMDEVRASSEAVKRHLGIAIERLNGSVERGQRDVLAKLDQLQARLERVENHTAATRTRSADSVEPRKSAPPTKQAATPLQRSTPRVEAKAALKRKPTETTTIEKWTVWEVADGMAILEGPGGVIEVASGDVIPGVGRVQSIVRRGGKWAVATTKGMIMAR